MKRIYFTSLGSRQLVISFVMHLKIAMPGPSRATALPKTFFHTVPFNNNSNKENCLQMNFGRLLTKSKIPLHFHRTVRRALLYGYRH